jgi:hypothetical protein
MDRWFNEGRMDAAVELIRKLQEPSTADTGNRTGARPAMMELMQASVDLKSEDDPRRFERIYRRAVRQAQHLVSEGDVSAQANLVRSVNPGDFHLAPDIAFVLDYSFSHARSNIKVQRLGIATNLAGSAIGDLLDNVGIGWLKDYLKDNTALTAALPLSGSDRIGSSLSLGLGHVPIALKGKKGLHGVDLWPTLDFETTDTKDAALPGSVVAGFAQDSPVSTVTIDVSIVSASAAEAARNGDEKATIVPVVSVGVGIPQYYPGSGVQALGALFSDSRTKYVKAGRPRFSFSISYPIRKLVFKKASTTH